MARTGRERSQRRRMARRAARSKIKPKREAPGRRIGTFHIARFRMSGTPPSRGYLIAIVITTLLILSWPTVVLSAQMWLGPEPPELLDGLTRMAVAMVSFAALSLFMVAVVSPFVAVFALIYIWLDGTVSPKK